MLSNEHPDMSGNPMDAPDVCDQCGREFNSSFAIFGCEHDHNKSFCSAECANDYDDDHKKSVEESSTGRNSMQPIPQEIRTLIERCEVNEVRFDNDDMSTALTYAEALRIENKRLCEALKRARELARVHNYTMRDFAIHCGITPFQLSEWTDSTPNREPDFKD